MPPKKRIAIDAEHGFIGEKKSKAKPREITHQPWLEQYFVDRDDVLLGDMFVSNETKEEILNRRK